MSIVGELKIQALCRKLMNTEDLWTIQQQRSYLSLRTVGVQSNDDRTIHFSLGLIRPISLMKSSSSFKMMAQ